MTHEHMAHTSIVRCIHPIFFCSYFCRLFHFVFSGVFRFSLHYRQFYSPFLTNYYFIQIKSILILNFSSYFQWSGRVQNILIESIVCFSLCFDISSLLSYFVLSSLVSRSPTLSLFLPFHFCIFLCLFLSFFSSLFLSPHAL